jgi:hypothetical protein
MPYLAPERGGYKAPPTFECTNCGEKFETPKRIY